MPGLLFTLIFLFASSFVAFAQLVPNHYIVELSGDPAASVSARQGRRARPNDEVFQSRLRELGTQHQALRPLIERHGGTVHGATRAVLNALLVEAGPESVKSIASLPGVKRVHPVRLYHKSLDHALPLHGVPDAWNLSGGMSNAGLGIKIAIIDTGIDAAHPAFQDPTLPMPDGFPRVNQSSDLIYTNNKIIVARSYTAGRASGTAQDTDGHGTGVAMTAAGVSTPGPFGLITGVAPRAYLGSYKVFPDSGGAPDDLIIRAIDDAVADGMDVLNLSLGSGAASRAQDDPLVLLVENAVAAGKLVTISAGNDGPDPNTIGSPGSAPDAISVGSMSNDRIFSGSLKVAGGTALMALPGDGPNTPASVTGNMADVAALEPTGLACGALPAGSLTGAIALILRGACNFEDKIQNAAQAGAIAVVVYAAANNPDPIGMATGTASLPAAMVSNPDGASLRAQLANGPVSAVLNLTPSPVSVNSNRISGYSSIGPSPDLVIKPDLIAVGESISTAKPLANDGSANDGYVVESGTSFSSPMVAGAAALLKSARPGLTAAQYKSLLINTASVFPAQLPIQQTGSGYLNMRAALQSTVAATPTSLSFGTGGSSVDYSQTLTLTNLGAAADTFSITVVPLAGSVLPLVAVNTVQLDPGVSRDIPVRLYGAGLSEGAYQGYLLIQGTQNAISSRVPYWYGIPSRIPANLTILDSPQSGAPGSRQTIVFRLTDSEGLPMSQTATARFTAGNGTVSSITSVDSSYPGAYQAVVRLGSAAITDVVTIRSGGLTKDVPIQVKLKP